MRNIQIHLQFVLWGALALSLLMLAGKMHFSPTLLLSAFSPTAGVQQSLSPEVIDANRLIEQHGIKRYALSDALAVHDHPLIESSYPARLEPDAPWVIAAYQQKEFSHCRAVADTSRITLYDCTDSPH